MMSSKVNVTKKACDGCKVRKVRCGGGSPCEPCTLARIQCTYLRMHERRGPQKLRATTRRLIEQEQRRDVPTGPSGYGSERLPTNVLASLLYIYHIRMYPVWPIVRVDELINALQEDVDGHDHETRALATGLAAATMAQLKLGGNSIPDCSTTAESLAVECLEARKAFDYRSRVNLTNIRTAFFLHVYYENHQAGGSESVLYLREAITMAQMMYLHREASYASLTLEEQQIRRRVLWLLFVTERGVCILHKLPVVLKTDTAMPDTRADDESEVLPAFIKLLALFRLFEQTCMFDIVEDYHLGLELPLTSTSDTRFDDILDDGFRDAPCALERVSDVQRADICVTRHWMRILTWKAVSHFGTFGSSSSHWRLSPVFPLSVAKDLIGAVYNMPKTALQAHGFGMQLKLHEIANSLADTVTDTNIPPTVVRWDTESRPSHILGRLHSILSALTDGEDSALLDMLYGKVARAYQMQSPSIPPAMSSVQTRPRRHGAPKVDFRAKDADCLEPTHLPQTYSNDVGFTDSIAAQTDQATGEQFVGPEVSRFPIAASGDTWSQSLLNDDPSTYLTVEQPAAETNALDELTEPLLNLYPTNTTLENMRFDWQRDQPSFEAYHPLLAAFESFQVEMVNAHT